MWRAQEKNNKKINARESRPRDGKHSGWSVAIDDGDESTVMQCVDDVTTPTIKVQHPTQSIMQCDYLANCNNLCNKQKRLQQVDLIVLFIQQMSEAENERRLDDGAICVHKQLNRRKSFMQSRV